MDELKLPDGRARSVPGQQRPDPGHGQDRLRQVDHARRDDRRHQHPRKGPYPHHRGSDRIRAQRKNCLISQREIGVHAGSFSGALLSALREDPDVILVGELRDLETMSIAVTAAEMGILVMGTLHTNGAAATVDRLVNAFPGGQTAPCAHHAVDQPARRGLAAAIPSADKQGRVAALEILINTPAVANLIRQGKMDQLENAMQSGARIGMRPMDSAIQTLLDQRPSPARMRTRRPSTRRIRAVPRRFLTHCITPLFII